MSTAKTEREAAAKLPSGDVVAILLQQHARIRDLFAQVMAADGDAKRASFNELRALLAIHETGEEMILRPTARKAAGEAEAQARNHEEEEASAALSRLEAMDINSAEFDSLLARLEKDVSDHAEHEESEEFPAVRRACDQGQLNTMGRMLVAAEKAAPTHPHPTVAGSTTAQWAAGPFASLVDRAKDAINAARS